MPRLNRPRLGRFDYQARFADKVEPEPNSGCLLWMGSMNRSSGYGMLKMNSKHWLSHRAAWVFAGNELTPGMQLDHLCRVRVCVNPRHLEEVTPRENTLRGNTPAAANARKTHCHRGHELRATNLYKSKSNRRICRTCSYQHTREYRMAAHG